MAGVNCTLYPSLCQVNENYYDDYQDYIDADLDQIRSSEGDSRPEINPGTIAALVVLALVCIAAISLLGYMWVKSKEESKKKLKKQAKEKRRAKRNKEYQKSLELQKKLTDKYQDKHQRSKPNSPDKPQSFQLSYSLDREADEAVPQAAPSLMIASNKTEEAAVSDTADRVAPRDATISMPLETVPVKDSMQVQDKSRSLIEGDGSDDSRNKSMVLLADWSKDQVVEKATFGNQEEKMERSKKRRGKNRRTYAGSVIPMTDEHIMGRRGYKGLDFKYKFLGGTCDLGSVHPKYEDKSNQTEFDIVLVRLYLINDDFVARSRYLSGRPFGFKHDIIYESDNDDDLGQDEMDSYSSGTSNARMGGAF